MMNHRSTDDFFKTPLGKFLSWHLTYGFSLFPIHGITAEGHCTCREGASCGHPGKHPYTAHGFKDATKDREAITRLFDGRTDLNVGIATGKESGVIVIDLDGQAGEESWKAMTEANRQSPVQPGMIFETGKGRHLLFRYPNVIVKSRQKLAGYEGVDVRADGGYIVAPPSTHHSGRKYRVREESFRLGVPHAPTWLMSLLLSSAPRRAEPAGDYTATSGATPAWSAYDVRGMLDALDPSMGYGDWIHVGMALHSGGYPLSMWDDWSQRGRQYKPNCCVSHWKSFRPGQGITMGTLVDMARTHGWKPAEMARERQPADVSNVISFAEKVKNVWRERQEAEANPTQAGAQDEAPAAEVSAGGDDDAGTGQFGFSPLKLPGMIGDTVRWITLHAFFDQPELALLNVLAFAGACMGRRYASPLDTRTNIYLVGIAGTGQGKDFSRKMIQGLAARAELSAFVGGNAIRSGSGLAREMESRASQIMMLDEFGMFLTALSDPKTMPYLRETSKLLMEFYSASNGSYNHGSYGDAKLKPIVLHQPNLCIYGTTTLSSYVPALRKGAIESGDLNRFIVVPSTVEVTVKRHVPPIEYPAPLVEAWKRLELSSEDGLGAANSCSVVGRIRRVEWGIGVEDEVYQMRVEQLERIKKEGPTGALWARYAENAIKVAMIFAIARDTAEPVVTIADLDIGKSIVGRSIRYMEELATEHMAETEHEANGHEMLRFIRSQGTAGVSRSSLLRRFRRLKRKDIDELICSLQEQGVMEPFDAAPTGGAGRPPVMFRAR
ncbi:bifunctional DNA primase/polymerase [Phenylobacterium sp.]|uniref:bifunctional DNA primase/polymerase n=1 Tax=Phenylobacterium sp. TaxID=1871053 RepID=UPI00301CD230